MTTTKKYIVEMSCGIPLYMAESLLYHRAGESACDQLSALSKLNRPKEIDFFYYRMPVTEDNFETLKELFNKADITLEKHPVGWCKHCLTFEINLIDNLK